MKTTLKYLFLTAAFGVVTVHAEDDVDCEKIAASVAQQVKADKSEVLEIVDKAVSENKECADFIVIAAIQASNASEALVGQIVQTAGNAAPGQLSNIVAAAVGAAPSATGAINSAAQTVQGGAGAEAAPNPLNAPGGTPAGQAQGAADAGSSQNSAGAGNTSGNGAGQIVVAPVPPSEPAPSVTDPN